MTRSFTEYADRLTAAGFVAGCVDLYDGAIATTADEAKTLRSAPRRAPMYRAIIRAGRAVLADPASGSANIALVGFSMGGHWAMWLAQRADLPIAGVVVYYATRAVNDPVGPHPVLAHFAETDPFVTHSARATMQRSLLTHGWPYLALDHPGTGHWFAESADPAYDDAAATTARGRTIEFLRALPWS